MSVSLTRRTACFNHELLPGEYRQDNGDLTSWCVTSCSDCKGLTRLMRRKHSVDVFGNVTPVCVCPLCKVVHDIVLLDWVPEAKGSS